jgi:tetratricopeptide (TPR) repeat protein
MKFYLAYPLTFVLLLFFMSIASYADNQLNQDASDHFLQGQILYNTADYLTALPAFERAVELAPLSPKYHHMLGKCYGRIAEQGNWLTALRYVGKTLSAFKKAVELDDNNIQALVDLEEFYRRAPEFLGGSKAKATKIRARLEKLHPELDIQR